MCLYVFPHAFLLFLTYAVGYNPVCLTKPILKCAWKHTEKYVKKHVMWYTRPGTKCSIHVTTVFFHTRRLVRLIKDKTIPILSKKNLKRLKIFAKY